MKKKYTKSINYVNGFKGKHQPDSAKKKIGVAAKLARTGVKLTEAHKRKIGKSNEKEGGWNQLVKTVYSTTNNICRICMTTERLTINHIIPRIAGGKDVLVNLEILCLSCNLKEYHRIVRLAMKSYFKELQG